ncbi:MAG TPA: cytochrome c oxidase subunit II [Trebonia sp.]
MAADVSSAAGSPVVAGRKSDAKVLLITWIAASVIATLIVALVWGPHMPPGRASTTAASQQFDYQVLGSVATPVVVGVLLYFGYALIFWRRKPGDDTDAAPLHGNIRVQATWVIGTSLVVLLLAGFGTYELIAPAGAGAGEGPQPIWKPAGTTTSSLTSWTPGGSNILQVQVIGQQWAWTFRYPQFGGFETTQLVLPVNEPVALNVTSLDVIHSFWAIQLGVKADANPGLDNIAYTTPQQTGNFEVRCVELCGIWHGSMYTQGSIVSATSFAAWAQQTETKLAAVTKLLPPYAPTYDPTVVSDLGKVNTELGLTGAGGGYYNPADPEQP